MKIKITSLLFWAILCAATAQKISTKHLNNPMAVGHFVPKSAGDEFLDGHFGPNIPPTTSVFRAEELLIGSTVYDLQANATDNNRLINLGNGDLRACWTMSKNLGTSGTALPSWPDRGTGYNQATGGTWGAQPLVRLESKRAGFPSMAITDNGTEMVVTHIASIAPLTGYSLNAVTRAAGATTWTEKVIPRVASKGSLWPRAAAGGNNLYVISLTTPTGTFGGVSYEGMNGKVVFSRSKDGGATWDKVDYSIPGLDSTQWKAIGGESYAIDAVDNYVAIGIFNWLNDVIVFKSNDGGDTWEKLTVYNFPIENYTYDTGYSIGDIDTLDAGRPTAAAGAASAITSDDHGAVRVDALGKVHCAFGAYYMNDSLGGDMSFNWWPTSLGTLYWNEDFGQDLVPRDGEIPLASIANVIDYNNDGEWNVDIASEYNTYANTAPASMPTLGLNSGTNTVYLGVSVADERYKDAESLFAYRHVHVYKINGAGTTADPLLVEGPLDVTVKAAADATLIPFTENAFPFMARNCDDKVHVIFQSDLVPGSGVTDMTTSGLTFESTINYACFADNEVVSVKNILPQAEVSVKLMPNPASEMLQIDLTFAKKADKAQLVVFDMNGREVLNQNFANLQNDRLFVPVAQLQNGIYSLTIRTDAGFVSRKFSVLH
jgi:Secretion system C-terminal sorting domain